MTLCRIVADKYSTIQSKISCKETVYPRRLPNKLNQKWAKTKTSYHKNLHKIKCFFFHYFTCIPLILISEVIKVIFTWLNWWWIAGSPVTWWSQMFSVIHAFKRNTHFPIKAHPLTMKVKNMRTPSHVPFCIELNMIVFKTESNAWIKHDSTPKLKTVSRKNIKNIKYRIWLTVCFVLFC